MAIWQFDISFVARDGRLPWRTDEGHEVPALSAQRTAQAKAWLDGEFGAPWEMLENWFVFGDEVGSRLDLLLNEDETSELSVRIDVRNDPSAFITKVCELGKLLGCVLFSAEFWSQIEPEPSEVVLAAKASRAAAYVQNPMQFLRGVAGDA